MKLGAPLNPAFPVNAGDIAYFGMTLRDYFAAKAMEAWLIGWATENSMPKLQANVMAEIAYEAADAMLKEREK